MWRQNFFEDPQGVLQEIQQQAQHRNVQQQTAQENMPPPQPQPRPILTTFTVPSHVLPLSPSTPSITSTTPSPQTYPSSTSLSSDQQQPTPASTQPPPVAAAAAAVSRRPKPGILRLDMSKPRRSSGGSVEFRNQPQVHATVSFTYIAISYGFCSLCLHSLFSFCLTFWVLSFQSC